MQIDRRSNMILQLVVEAYIHHATPVSSGGVLKRAPQLDMSAATVRLVMADLEAQGLLKQPHTSSGRVPTERGWRVYVDHLCLTDLCHERLRSRDRSRLEATAQQSDAKTFPNQLGQTLSGLCGQLTVLAVPKFWGSRLREVGLVRCDAQRILAYFVSPNGLVQQKLLQTDFDFSHDELARIQNYLNTKLAHRTLAQVRALIASELADASADGDGDEKTLKTHALAIGRQLLPDVQLDVLIEGASHLLDQPEFADARKVRGVLRTLEEKKALWHLLNCILEQKGVHVVLGSEHGLSKMADVACVGCTWESASGDKTAISLLGPSRMDYGRLVPLLGYATEVFGRFWEQL